MGGVVVVFVLSNVRTHGALTVKHPEADGGWGTVGGGSEAVHKDAEGLELEDLCGVGGDSGFPTEWCSPTTRKGASRIGRGGVGG